MPKSDAPKPVYRHEELPRYRSTKIVRAAVIKEVRPDRLILTGDRGDIEVELPPGHDLFGRGDPRPGDVFVDYDNGRYASFAPAEHFWPNHQRLDAPPGPDEAGGDKARQEGTGQAE